MAVDLKLIPDMKTRNIRIQWMNFLNEPILQVPHNSHLFELNAVENFRQGIILIFHVFQEIYLFVPSKKFCDFL